MSRALPLPVSITATNCLSLIPDMPASFNMRLAKGSQLDDGAALNGMQWQRLTTPGSMSEKLFVVSMNTQPGTFITDLSIFMA